MQFMISITVHPERAQTPPAAELIDAEFQAVRGLYMSGLIQQIWVRADGSGACMIVEAPSTDEVAVKLGTLPLVRDGYLQSPTIVPLAPYWGFAPRS